MASDIRILDRIEVSGDKGRLLRCLPCSVSL